MSNAGRMAPDAAVNAPDTGTKPSTPDPRGGDVQPEKPDDASTGGETPAPMRCADITGTPTSSPGSGYPGGRWTVPAAAYGTVITANVRVMMSDGVALVGDVSIPPTFKHAGARQRSSR